MDLAEAQNILRDYMAPRSHAINVFAQKGLLLVTGDNKEPYPGHHAELLAEAKQELIEAIAAEARDQDSQARSAYRVQTETAAGAAREHFDNTFQLRQVAKFVDEHFSD